MTGTLMLPYALNASVNALIKTLPPVVEHVGYRVVSVAMGHVVSFSAGHTLKTR
jgi:hypothetical protein